MPALERRADLGLADARRIGTSLAAELRDARVAAGISQSTAARAVGMSKSQWVRLERNELRRPDLVQLCRAARALGLKGFMKLFPAGNPVRDGPQLALLQRLESRLGAPLALRREMPLPIEGDLRAWDGAIEGDDEWCFVEGESHLGDAQAVERRIRLKLRDDPRATMILLVLARSDHNRRVMDEHREAFRDLLPLDSPAILRALRRGRVPSASGIVFL
jgi:transcriptional regulator with XRE-family HTH domain